jgi:hypothetical protein
MQNVLHRKTFDIFSDLNWKDNKTLICNISRERRKKKCLPALKNSIG